MNADDFKARFEKLRRDYVATLDERVLEIESLCNSLGEPTKRMNVLTALGHRSHNLAGSGATYGFSEVSDVARQLEQFATLYLAQPDNVNAESISDSQRLCGALHEAVKAGGPVPLADFPSIRQATAEDNDEFKLIYLVGDDIDLMGKLELQLSRFGYSVRVFHTVTQLRDALTLTLPGAIVMDVAFPEDPLGGPNFIGKICQRVRHHPPVIFMSERADLESRLEAVRSGGIAYLKKPFGAGHLVDELDRLFSDESREPHRALLVDDSPSFNSYFSLVLEQAGVEGEIVSDPIHVLDTIRTFRPELILLDMYMPRCSGVELAQVIRQVEDFVSIPIVFLSTETNLGKQLSAMQFGADDFLVKPIEPVHLIASIKSRVERYRALRTMMVRDSLTGLLNHTALKEQLDNQLARVQREHQLLAFVMIDLDHFKKVNDTYGHAAGDRVIRGLARMLRQRLRKSDAVGRYGGEEFAAVLPAATADQARQIMEEIREDFANLKFISNDVEFSATFSCGIATFPGFSDAVELSIAADEALYRAKDQGRNCIVLATI